MAGTVIADYIQAAGSTLSMNVGNTLVLTANASGLTYVPTGNVNINIGSTASLTMGNVTVTSNITTRNVTATGTLSVTGATTLSSTLAAGNTTITGTLSATGQTTLTGGVNLTSVVGTSFVAATFTPVMAIGAGAPTSYTTQVGNYLQIGTAGNGRVFFTITVRLNVAGSATGAVTFTGLPVAARAGAATERNPAAVYMTGYAGGSLTTEQIWATVAQGASTVVIWTYTGGTASAFSVGALSDSQQFNINGSYPI